MKYTELPQNLQEPWNMQCHCTRIIQVSLLCKIYCKIPLVKQKEGGLGLSLIKYKNGHVTDTHKWKVCEISTKTIQPLVTWGAHQKSVQYGVYLESSRKGHSRMLYVSSQNCLSMLWLLSEHPCIHCVPHSIKLKRSVLQSRKDVKNFFLASAFISHLWQNWRKQPPKVMNF
jgi:hypothetical protein